MPSRDDIDLDVRLRLARWLRWYRERKSRDYPVDADFAKHVGIKPGHLSNVLTYARSGGVRGRSPGMDLLLKLSDAARHSTDEMLRDEPPALGSSPPGEAPKDPVAAPQANRQPGGRRTGGGRR